MLWVNYLLFAVIELFIEMEIDALLIQEMGVSPYEKLKAHGEMILYHRDFERILLQDVIEKFEAGELEILDDTNMDKIIKHHEKRHPRHGEGHHQI